MRSLEDVGRMLDSEVEKIRRFFTSEVKPATKRELVSALRSTARRLEELARELEAEPPAEGPAKKAE